MQPPNTDWWAAWSTSTGRGDEECVSHLPSRGDSENDEATAPITKRLRINPLLATTAPNLITFRGGNGHLDAEDPATNPCVLPTNFPQFGGTPGPIASTPFPGLFALPGIETVTEKLPKDPCVWAVLNVFREDFTMARLGHVTEVTTKVGSSPTCQIRWTAPGVEPHHFTLVRYGTDSRPWNESNSRRGCQGMIICKSSLYLGNVFLPAGAMRPLGESATIKIGANDLIFRNLKTNWGRVLRGDGIEMTLCKQVEGTSGNFGTVWSAEYIRNGETRIAAVKVLDIPNIANRLGKNLDDPHFVDMTRREYLIHKRLEHPNIPRLLLSYLSRKRIMFLGMDFIVGRTLEQVIEGQEMGEPGLGGEAMMKTIFVQLFSALKYIHSSGYCHRDLKPSNIMLWEDDPMSIPSTRTAWHKPYIIDFGLADYITSATTMCGTARYQAPEILKGEPYTEAVDMWAMGAVLHYCFCARPPFNNDDEAKHSQPDFSSTEWTYVSYQAKQLITRLLSRDPKGRPSSATVLRDEWFLDCWKRPYSYAAGMKAASEGIISNCTQEVTTIFQNDVAAPVLLPPPQSQPQLTAPWTLGNTQVPLAHHLDRNPPDSDTDTESRRDPHQAVVQHIARETVAEPTAPLCLNQPDVTTSKSAASTVETQQELNREPENLQLHTPAQEPAQAQQPQLPPPPPSTALLHHHHHSHKNDSKGEHGRKREHRRHYSTVITSMPEGLEPNIQYVSNNKDRHLPHYSQDRDPKPHHKHHKIIDKWAGSMRWQILLPQHSR
ncbi:CAMK protein kinase [Pelomyxa schiedti]|nr:CAMK protein kinase [Pelomyxa schiedti]